MIVYRELSSLARDLGVQPRTLYALANGRRKHCHKVSIPKRSGGTRELMVPDAALKAVQRRILEVLLQPLPVSSYAMAYRFGGSALRAASPHAGKPVILKLDLYQFFDSVRYTAVKEAAFPAEIYAEPLRILLSLLCYGKDSLPQGAPTSPAISNRLLFLFDEQTGAWCRARGIAYSRYCDDLVFSGDFDPAEVIRHVRPELQKLGFLLNGQKTRVLRQHQQQLVTGLVVNEHPAVPSSYRRKLRQELYYCRRFGVKSHLQQTGCADSETVYLRQLLGRVCYVLHAAPDSAFFQEARSWLLAELRRQVQEG